MKAKNATKTPHARNGGRSRLVMDAIKSSGLKPHEQFHTANVEVQGLDPKQVGSALCLLTKKGLLERGALKGYYALPNGAGKPINPSQAIYDLLDFMAKAEAPLRRAAKILEAVDNA